MLGRVHGPVGRGEQLIEVVAVLGVRCDPDRSRQPAGAGALGQRELADGHPHRLRDPGSAVGVAPVEQHHELLTAEADHGIGTAHTGAQARGDPLQDQIPGGMAAVVVHRLEVIKIDEEQ